MHAIDLNKAKAQLPELVESALGGEEVVLTRDDRPVVKLVPVAASKARPLFGSAKGLITIADDFDAPLEDFDEYMR
ncbi:MAG: type II toxin-antitoxin system prevent-host-death family antitoxin [Candidatus Binatia bacterium]|jgi:prevent-host-death family protein